MFKKYFILYILLIIAFNIILFCYYKSYKENFVNITNGIETFNIVYKPINSKEYSEILENAIANKYNNIVIIDENFTFTQPKELINKRIEEFLNRFGNDWDVLQLSSNSDNITTEIYPGLESVAKSNLSGACVINSPIFDKLYKLLNNETLNHDNLESLQKSSKWYMLNPPC